MGKSTISMAIFNSFLYVHQAGYFNLPKGIPKAHKHEAVINGLD